MGIMFVHGKCVQQLQSGPMGPPNHNSAGETRHAIYLGGLADSNIIQKVV